ncbi:MAG: NADH-quinone oxidoreductase subunit D [Propionibacteriaceae bacterium]|nr:NADH-quinone oxidoreductase subunit D [Propionibacteriaceae bacterium]
MGDRHPSTAGVIGLDVEFRDGLITSADIQPGHLHRAAEKLFEVRDYRSLIMLADRHDWLSSFSGELVVTGAIEHAMGLVPPPRATWLRTLLAECGRLHSHLSYLSHVSTGDTTTRLWSVVEGLRDAMQEWSGNRVHPMLNRVGGLAFDMPPQWPSMMGRVLRQLDAVAAELQQDLERLEGRLGGLAVTDADCCMQYGLSGPVARAAGLELDLRGAGGLAYDDVFVSTPQREGGDALTRFQVLVDELTSSQQMVQRCLDGAPGGDFSVRLSRRLKVPEGEHLSEIEAPWGMASALLVSRGGQTPWRLALRTPTFANVSTLSELLVGARENQIADVVASMGYSIGDLDK